MNGDPADNAKMETEKKLILLAGATVFALVNNAAACTGAICSGLSAPALI
jgi:hypothetical protein